MCGRISLSANLTEILARFELMKTAPEVQWKPLYNGSPGQMVPIVLSDSPNFLSMGKWGFIPSWSKDEKIGSSLINARAESIGEKPSYRSAWKKGQRCLVIVDGFFEWKVVGRNKEPYCICLTDKKPFGLAGLWESLDKDRKPIITFTIITTTPNALMKPIHDRMPVILPQPMEKKWLDPILPADEAEDLLVPFPERDVLAYRVSPLINNPKNNVPEVLAPFQADRTQTRL